MTLEEKAEEKAKDFSDNPKQQVAYTCGYLDGVYEGLPKWHKVADGDLPKEEDLEMQVLCFTTEGYQLLSLFSDPKPIFDYYEVIAWCEIPTYKE